VSLHCNDCRANILQIKYSRDYELITTGCRPVFDLHFCNKNAHVYFRMHCRPSSSIFRMVYQSHMLMVSINTVTVYGIFFAQVVVKIVQNCSIEKYRNMYRPRNMDIYKFTDAIRERKVLWEARNED